MQTQNKTYTKEARRQSLLASKQESIEDKLWEENSDTSGWE